jgi:LPXTG-motif cell wall-anchored protein
VETLSTGRLAILGLEKGEYWLKEIDAPNGYNKLAAAIHVVIDGTTTEYAFTKEVKDGEGNVTTKTEFYDVKHVPVTNNKGVELPSTGGEGTMMLITIGTLMAIGFAVFLITHKKMSTYTD